MPHAVQLRSGGTGTSIPFSRTVLERPTIIRIWGGSHSTPNSEKSGRKGGDVGSGKSGALIWHLEKKQSGVRLSVRETVQKMVQKKKSFPKGNQTHRRKSLIVLAGPKENTQRQCRARGSA